MTMTHVSDDISVHYKQILLAIYICVCIQSIQPREVYRDNCCSEAHTVK